MTSKDCDPVRRVIGATVDFKPQLASYPPPLLDLTAI